MAFNKSFWKQRQFGKKDHNYGEAYVFINGREKEVINMPYFFNLIAITHKENITSIENYNPLNLFKKGP